MPSNVSRAHSTRTTLTEDVFYPASSTPVWVRLARSDLALGRLLVAQRLSLVYDERLYLQQSIYDPMPLVRRPDLGVPNTRNNTARCRPASRGCARRRSLIPWTCMIDIIIRVKLTILANLYLPCIVPCSPQAPRLHPPPSRPHQHDLVP